MSSGHSQKEILFISLPSLSKLSNIFARLTTSSACHTWSADSNLDSYFVVAKNTSAWLWCQRAQHIFSSFLWCNCRRFLTRVLNFRCFLLQRHCCLSWGVLRRVRHGITKTDGNFFLRNRRLFCLLDLVFFLTLTWSLRIQSTRKPRRNNQNNNNNCEIVTTGISDSFLITNTIITRHPSMMNKPNCGINSNADTNILQSTGIKKSLITKPIASDSPRPSGLLLLLGTALMFATSKLEV